jgi:undecaprenyl-diphosphatase
VTTVVAFLSLWQKVSVRDGWQNRLGHGWRWARNQDLVTLTAGLVGALALWGFVAVASVVTRGGTPAVDERILRGFRVQDDLAQPIGPAWVTEAARDATALGSVLVVGFVSTVVIGFVALRRQYHAAILITAALGGGLLLNVLLKSLFGRPRPTVVPALVDVSSASFPSGHALLSSVVYLTLAALVTRLVRERRVKVYALAVAFMAAFLVGVTRVFLGVHYPSDVIAGWSVGLAWAIVCWMVARALQRSGRVERTEQPR